MNLVPAHEHHDRGKSKQAQDSKQLDVGLKRDQEQTWPQPNAPVDLVDLPLRAAVEVAETADVLEDRPVLVL